MFRGTFHARVNVLSCDAHRRKEDPHDPSGNARGGDMGWGTVGKESYRIKYMRAWYDDYPLKYTSRRGVYLTGGFRPRINANISPSGYPDYW